MSTVIRHPNHDLMAEAQREREIVESFEAQALQDEIFAAVERYSEFLDRHGLLYGASDTDLPRLKASALMVTRDYARGTDIGITLKDGALNRVYGNGVNPDPFGAGPQNIPHKPRGRDD